MRQQFQCQYRTRRKAIKNIWGRKKRSNYLQNPSQFFQIKLEEQNYFLLLASFSPGIPGTGIAAVSHSVCVWTLVFQSTAIPCCKSAKEFQPRQNTSCHGTISLALWICTLLLSNQNQGKLKSCHCKMLSYTALMFHQTIPLCLRYLTASTSAIFKCLYLIFCIWT